MEASAEELSEMFLGRRVFTRGQDMREYRLVLLIKHVFQGELPSEQRVSALFQTTQTQSRALIRAVMSKYQYELQDHLKAAMTSTLSSATQDGGPDSPHVVLIDNDTIIEALNRALAGIDGSRQQISKLRDRLTSYEIPHPSYELLAREFGLTR